MDYFEDVYSFVTAVTHYSSLYNGLSSVLCSWERCFLFVTRALLSCVFLRWMSVSSPEPLPLFVTTIKQHNLHSARFPAVPVSPSPAANSALHFGSSTHLYLPGLCIPGQLMDKYVKWKPLRELYLNNLNLPNC